MKYRATRCVCDRHVTMLCNGHAPRIILRDISSSGAKLMGATAPPRGARITLNLLGVERAASVI